ncbi:MAG TPA: bifunctional DNA-formamidopyrimidine glycosylase/DNA-(apurinic or apyrimidinic site) lyase [Candidatus Saccharimonadales bacterium]|nr:bifunctional DNA-formamidopyrimidine glycosylase/DNA-(apurinic or apyrimidinic site) lyase [Candidatus Saccharimonadales bacterium]
MPELPEVETVARDLRGLVLGATIVGARGEWPRTIRSHSPEAFGREVAGHVIEGVARRAKLLLLELSGGLVLAIHLKMTGQLFVGPAGTPADRHVRLVLELDDGRELRFRDMRKFGRVGLYPRAAVAGGAAAVELGAGDIFDLGPEPLDPEFTLARFRAHLRGRRGRLKTLLTDQAFLAGIGNIYADEVLWRARLHPLRSAASLRRDDQKRLYEGIRGVLAEAVTYRGSSIDDYTAPDGDGGMQDRLQVYQRAGEPCPRCGRPLRRVVLGARSTHFCSWCQRLSAADRAASAGILRTERRPARRGPRWTELAGPGAIGLTAGEAAARGAAQATLVTKDAERRARTERARRAAATRRAAARASSGTASSPAGSPGSGASRTASSGSGSCGPEPGAHGAS